MYGQIAKTVPLQETSCPNTERDQKSEEARPQLSLKLLCSGSEKSTTTTQIRFLSGSRAIHGHARIAHALGKLKEGILPRGLVARARL